MVPVTVRGVVLGAGVPKICVPLVERTQQEILMEARAVCRLPVDVVEWRADYLQGNPREALATLSLLRQALEDIGYRVTGVESGPYEKKGLFSFGKK